MVGVFVCIFCFLISHTEGVIFRMFPEIMYTLARGVATSRSFSTTAFTSARVFNAPKKFRVTEEPKVKEVKVPKGDFRGEVSGYREERVVLSDDGAIIACWHPQVLCPSEKSKPCRYFICSCTLSPNSHMSCLDLSHVKLLAAPAPS